jgi:pimeloyl-ACP methyl ester carboxylesterase
MAKVFVLYDFTDGHAEKLARVVIDGARSEGAEVTAKRDLRNGIRRTFSNPGCRSSHPKELSMSAAVSSTFSCHFRRVAAGLFASQALGALSAHAAPMAFPADFRSSQVVNADATINVRVGGHGPAVVLIHGFGETGDMWSPMAAELEKDHTVVVPDLRGMGLSSHPTGGYDKWTQAGDIRAVLDKLGIDCADIVGHDIGVMVAYAYAARYPDKTSRLVVIDSPIPGIPPWNQIVRMPALWHFNFGGPDAERLVAGRERIYLDRFWDEFAGDPSKIDEATRRHYAAIYARPGRGRQPQGDADEADDAGARHRRREGLRRQRGGPDAQRGDERAGSHRAERRPLADGGSARADNRRGAGLPRCALSPAAASAPRL